MAAYAVSEKRNKNRNARQPPLQGNIIYFPKAGTYQNIEEFLTAKANKANKDVGSNSFFLTFSPYSPSWWIFSSRLI
jgi:hypothetical protein